MTDEGEDKSGETESGMGLPGLEMEEVGPLDLPMPKPSGVEFQSPIARNGKTDGQRQNGQKRPEDTRSSDDNPGGQADESRSSDADDPLGEAAELGESYIDRVEDAIDQESCSFCRAALEQLRELPIDEQIKGVQELRELKQATRSGATESEVEDMLDTFEVVDEVMMV